MNVAQTDVHKIDGLKGSDAETIKSVREDANTAFRLESNVETLKSVREDANTAFRLEEDGCVLFTAVAGIVATIADSDDAEALVISSFVGTLIGIIAGSGWFFFRKRISQKTKQRFSTTPPSPNPWSRRFKNTFLWGQKLGELAASFLFFLPLNSPIFVISRLAIMKVTGYIFGILFGFAGVLFFKRGIHINLEKYNRIGRDGWSRYAKTGFVFGAAVGTMIAGIVCACFFPGFGLLAALAIGGAAGSVLGFASTLGIAPLYQYLRRRFSKRSKKPKTDKTQKEPYRTNHMRAGIVLGGFIGSIIVGVLGACVFPGIGAIAGAAIGSAIGSVIGGVIFACIGSWLARKIERGNPPKNSYDYAIRTGAMFGNNTGLGQAMSPLANNFAAIMPAVGGLTTSLIGFLREVFHARKVKTDERGKTNYIFPWTQVAASGIMIGSAVGAFIGMFFPPFGILIGGGLGGFIGGVIACCVEPSLRKMGYLKNIPGYAPEKQDKSTKATATPCNTTAKLNQALPHKNNKNTPKPNQKVDLTDGKTEVKKRVRFSMFDKVEQKEVKIRSKIQTPVHHRRPTQSAAA